MPYAVSMAAMIAWGRASDVRNNRVRDTALTMLLAAAALAIASFSTNHLLVLAALTLAMAGGLAGIGPFQSLLSSFSRGAAAASGLGAEGLAAAEHVRQQYAWPVVFRKLFRLYDEVRVGYHAG